MKLYTEEQVRKAIELSLLNAKLFIYKGLGDDKYFPTVDESINTITPIELPSDDEIEENSEKGYVKLDGNRILNWINGAKWMREQILNQKYNQTNVGNHGFEFDHNSTIPPTKGLCDAKSIYGSELNKELTLDERMHLWFESSRPNRDVCDYVDEMNDIDKAKYLDGCGISRTTKNK